MQLQDFDFALPPELIAQAPAAQRDQSRLMIVERAQHKLTHDVFANIAHYLRSGDVLVVNDTKVIPARLHGRKVATGGKVEVLLLHERAVGEWDVLAKPAARVAVGSHLEFGEGILHGQVISRQDSGALVMRFTPATLHALLDQCGEVPLPPYIKRSSAVEHDDTARYQTVYACHPGAVAAPTAGLHFTPALLTALEHGGVQRAALTLHVGWGTFQPIRTPEIERHHMAREFYRLGAAEAARIAQAQQNSKRVVAVGTTTTRTLETIAQHTTPVTATSGWTELFIVPGYHFRIVKAMITNFHLPQSTLFLLVCAFAGRELMLEAYRQAIAERYRFYSYGDAMLIM